MTVKVTRMVIEMDLQCSRCYKKIKKILCQIPQIQDQQYDEKKNTVLITVVCCSPEKIRQKIICMGGKTVMSVEILPEKPKKPEKKPEKAPEKKPEKEPEKKPEEKPEKPAPAPAPALPPPKPPMPVAGYPPVPVYPMVPMYPMVGVCCCPPFYGRYGGGPCYCGRRRQVLCDDGCGRPVWECQGGHGGPYPGQGRPVLCDDGCGRPVWECQGGNRGYYVSPCDYLSEENATACTVM